MKSQITNFKFWGLIFFPLLMVILFSCAKEEDPFAACRLNPTCEYFTCKVNGVRWEPQCNSEPLFGCTPWDVLYNRKTSGNLGMYIAHESKKQYFTLLVRNQILKIGHNQLFINANLQTRYSDLTKKENCIRYEIDTLVPHTFFVSRIDTISYYITGKFSFTGKNDCGEEVTISDGEFNLPYRF